MTTFIIDDEAHAVATIADYVVRTPGLELAGSATDPVSALKTLTADPPDLLFLDVDMPGLSGLELAGLVSSRTRVVFITAFREFGPEAFAISAADYLLKPVSYARFVKCVQKVQQQKAGPNDFIYVKGDLKGKLTRIAVAEILYIQSSLHYVDIYLPGEKIVTYLTLAELEEQLPRNLFCRVHRSFIVNLHRIKTVEQNEIRLENKERIPIGRGYRALFFNRIHPSLVVSRKD